MYTSVDLTSSLLGILAWLLIVIFICRAVYLSNRHVPIALILGVFFSTTLSFRLIESIVTPLDQFFSNLIQLQFHSTNGKGNTPSESTPLADQIFSPELWSNSLLLLLALTACVWISRELVQLSKKKDHEETNNYLKQNLLIMSTVIFAIYLSVSSLVTLPVVTSGKMLAKATTESKYELLTELSAEIDSLQEMDQVFEAAALSDLDELMSDISTGENNFSRAQTAFYQVLKTESGVQRLKIKETINIELPIGAAKIMTKMSQAEEANLTQVQRLEYKAQLYDWYTKRRSDLIAYVKNRNDLINNLKKVGLDSYGYELGKSITFDTVRIRSLYEKMQAIPDYLNAKNALLQPAEVSIPDQPRQGDHLGKFVGIMGWLLRIESYSLVVIMGLVGFGLLGAIGASFIKDRKKDNEPEGPLVRDVPKTLISGFMAAIVVYLGIQGSVSLLSGGSTGNFSPNNGYLLYFVALAAAVYSEVAWEWVKKRFKDQLNKNVSGAS